jgi:N6-L-threonylcarbamoyladenine synthase
MHLSENSDSLILGIETSCDDTCVSISDFNYNILWEKKYSQDLFNNKYNGIVPEVAARNHVTNIQIILHELITDFQQFENKIKYIAVTKEPGLIGSLITGISLAKGLSIALNAKLIYINHLQGHIHSILIDNKNSKIEYPALCLLLSGGHSQIMLLKSFNNFEILSKTLDDAAGEAFDKIARTFKLEPHGKSVESRAALVDESSFKFKPCMMNKTNINFSFSGLKTQVLYKYKELESDNLMNNDVINELCFAAQNAIIETIEYKLNACYKIIQNNNLKVQDFIICGGVFANLQARKMILNFSKENNLRIKEPLLKYSTDNAAMICMAAIEQIKLNNS